MFLALIFSTPILRAQSKINLDPAEWKLGEVELGRHYQTRVKVRLPNPSDKITRVRPSCECLSAEVISSQGQDASDQLIKVELHPDHTLNARFKSFLYIHINDQKKPAAQFNVTGKIKGKGFGLKQSEIVIFRTRTAKNYNLIREKLEALRQKQSGLIIKEHLAKDVDSYRLLAQFEKEYLVPRHESVEMFMGDGFFIGQTEILTKLNSLLKEEIIVPDQTALPILFFYSVGCGKCFEIRNSIFPELRKKYGTRISIQEFDVGELRNYEYLMDLEEKFSIKTSKPVTVFVSDKYLAGSNDIINKLDKTIEQVLKKPRPDFIGVNNFTAQSTQIMVGSSGQPKNNYKLKSRFKSFRVIGIIGAGLLDGVNPCAFATIIFFISFLSFVGRSRREIMIVGLFYTLTVFVTYLLLGIGLFKAFQSLSAYYLLSDIILYVMVGLVFCLAGLSLYDLVVYLKTKQTKGLALQLPLSLKQKIHAVIRDNVKGPGLVIGAIVIGFLVTLFEAVCTGQVYLPTIVFVLKDPELKVNAMFYLVLYNLMFILPLIVVFILAYFGISSQKLSKFSQKNLVLSKILMSLFFIGLGILLLIM